MRLKKEFTNRKTIGIGIMKGEICSLISLYKATYSPIDYTNTYGIPICKFFFQSDFI